MKEDLKQATKSTRNSTKEDERRNKQLHKMVACSLHLVDELGTLMKVVAEWIGNGLGLERRRKTKDIIKITSRKHK